jgi:hypothetical protein
VVGYAPSGHRVLGRNPPLNEVDLS